MRLLRGAIANGELTQPFRGADVNRALGINWGGSFLAKHRIGNPGVNGIPYSERFVQIERGLYRLK